MQRSVSAIVLVAVVVLVNGFASAGASPTFDTTPTLAISDVAVFEGDSGTRQLKFVVSLSHAATTNVTAQYSTADVSATGGAYPTTPGADYVYRLNKTLSIKAGAVVKPVVVTVAPDAVIEGDETMTVTLSSVTGAIPVDTIGSGTIRDDDTSAGFRMGVGDVTVPEGDVKTRNIAVVVGFSGPAPAGFTLTASTTNGTATGVAAPAKLPTGDYKSVNKSINVLAGKRFATIPIVVIPDGISEGDETLTVNISSSLGTVTDAQAAFTITDDATDRVDWIHQFPVGEIFDTAVDGSGNTIVVSSSGTTVPGAPEPNAGGSDGVIAKYTSAGTLLWAHLLGTAAFDTINDVAVDNSGNIYAAGATNGTLAGSPEPNAGQTDTFIVKYTPAGTIVWLHQLGTDKNDRADALEVDGSGNPMLGATFDFFAIGGGNVPDPVVAHYDSAGNLGAVNHRGASPAHVFHAQEYAGTRGPNKLERLDGDGNIIVANSIADSLTKYDATGTVLWTHNEASIVAAVGGIAVEIDQVDIDSADNIVIGGTNVVDGTQLRRSFVAYLDLSGTIAWTRTQAATASVGTPSSFGSGATFDSAGNVVVAGHAQGSGITGAREPKRDKDFLLMDSFAAKYDADGDALWIHQYGSKGNEDTTDLVADALGNVIVLGRTTGTIVEGSDLRSTTSGFPTDATIVRFLP